MRRQNGACRFSDGTDLLKKTQVFGSAESLSSNAPCVAGCFRVEAWSSGDAEASRLDSYMALKATRPGCAEGWLVCQQAIHLIKRTHMSLKNGDEHEYQQCIRKLQKQRQY